VTGDQLRALEALRFNFVQVPDDVWRPSPYHVDELHHDVMLSVAGGVKEAAASPDASPVGVAIQGQRGAGKTHLLGLVRQRVQAAEGYFFLVNPHDGVHFWESAAASVLDGLLRENGDPANGPGRQLAAFLRRLSRRARLLSEVEAAVVGQRRPTPRDLASVVAGLRRLAPQVGLECQDTLRALVLLGAPDFELQDLGYQYLLSMDEAEPGDRSRWGIHRGAKQPQRVVRDVSRLLALTGPSVIAVDQIDALIAQSVKAPTDLSGGEDEARAALMLEQIAGGLMALCDLTRRTLTVVACLPETWIRIRHQAVDTVVDRFREALQLHRIPTAEVGRAIVQRRFAARYAEVGFEPPYPTWPVSPSAFKDAPDFTPRGLLQRLDTHVQSCLRLGEVRVLSDLLQRPESVTVAQPAVGDLRALDARFAELRSRADVASALDPSTEDEVMPELLSAGLAAWIAERGETASGFDHDPAPGRKPALHARLRQTLDERTEDEVHWAFRAIASGNARNVQCRIRNACTMSGLAQGVAKRKLFLLRNTPWPSGRVTRETIAALTDAGGVTLPVTEEDLRTLSALRALLAKPDPNLPTWLAQRRPASGTALFQAALEQAAPEQITPVKLEPVPDPPQRAVGRARVPTRQHAPEPNDGSITIGMTIDDGQPLRVSLESLRKHMAIFAGSGSGKTVLIRRLIEECALRGVSAIVLDPNNDLARLGDPWPEPPPGWGPGDAVLAEKYLASTEVVVWTPRREAGRPLTFQPLPDFASVRGDRDELGLAIEAAAATLAPKAKVDGKTSKASLAQAVLHEALRHFAHAGGGGLRSFVDLLADLPDGVSGLAKGDKIAAELAETLRAAMVIDPMFGGHGTPLDPGVLLTPSAGKRARISVISLVGLTGDPQRQGFVNQLQMALFAWIKQHPVGDRPLGGLLVMDEAQTFAPSGAMTACTESTVALASQARKYGLGLVFATQAPKGLNNRVPGNAATQFFGFLNSPAQIEAAREMARAKGSAVVDISRLRTGEFYVAAPGLAFQRVRTPLCLSYHPPSPLTPEEVVERARLGPPGSPHNGANGHPSKAEEPLPVRTG
jgi:hypothetical protein